MKFYKIKIFLFYLFCILIGILNCKSKPDKAQIIADDCIQAHGGKNFQKLHISFDFRDKNYTIKINNDKFEYNRIGLDSLGNEIRDVLNNKGLSRYISNKKMVIADSMAIKYTNSINSVVYFALLPKALNDPAVNKTYLGEVKIGGQNYDKIKVTFNQENGGKDFEDIYIYWINQTTKLMEYFAYSYNTDGGGIRFREAINPNIIGGIRFQDYINYAPIDTTYSLENLDKAFIEGKLQEFSRIKNINIKAITK